MAQFNYIAVNKTGERIKGNLDAPNEGEVRVMLRAQQLRPLRIVKAGALEFDLAKIGNVGSGVSRADVLLFSRQLSILLSSGIPLVQGLDIIAAQVDKAGMKRVLQALKEKISGGAFLWQSMANYKDIFPDIFVNMVKAGESSGSLDVILKRLIKYLDDGEKLKKLVKGAMVYPIVVTLVGFLVMAVMLIYVIPKFEDMLKTQGQKLPAITQFVINSSHFFQKNFLFIIGAMVAVFYFIRAYWKTEEGKRFFDYIILKTPLFGDLSLKVAIARFARTMQTLLSSGINLLDALDICKSAVGNFTVEENIIRVRSEVENGKTLSSVMGKLPIFPSMVVQMVTVGEGTGTIDKMLDRVAEYYEEDVQNLVSGMTKLIEPLVLVVLGGMVGGMLIAMYMPIFTMAGGVS